MDLAVGVGDADIVQIEQADLADAAARQRLGRPGTDPADADHGDMRRCQPFEPSPAIQTGNAAETLIFARHTDL